MVRMTADQIADALRKHDCMSADDIYEITMALSAIVNRTPLFEGSEIAARFDEMTDDLETASDGEMIDSTEWEHSKEHKE